MTFHHFTFGERELEKRLIFLNPANHAAGGLDNLTPEMMEKREDQQQWKIDTVGAQEICDFFLTQNRKKITFEELEAYILDPSTPPSTIVTELKTAMDERKGVDVAKRTDAQEKIDRFLAYLQAQNEVIQDTKKKLNDAKKPQENFLQGKSIESVTGFVTTHLTKFSDGFAKAEPKDKAIMLAGAVAAWIVVSKLWKSSGNIPGGETLKKGLRVGAGTLLGFMAFEAVNRSVEQAYGVPLVGLKGKKFSSVFSTPKEEWDAKKHQEELENIANELKDMEIPDEFLNQIQDGKSKYAKGIVSLSSYSVGQLKDLYEQCEGDKLIPRRHPLYRSKFREDGMNDVERFLLVEDIATTLKLVDPATKKFIAGPDFDKKKNTSILYLALDFKDI